MRCLTYILVHSALPIPITLKNPITTHWTARSLISIKPIRVSYAFYSLIPINSLEN